MAGRSLRETRDSEIIHESLRLRAASPDKLLKALDDLDDYVLESARAGIRMRKPGISEKEAASELKGMFT